MGELRPYRWPNDFPPIGGITDAGTCDPAQLAGYLRALTSVAQGLTGHDITVLWGMTEDSTTRLPDGRAVVRVNACRLTSGDIRRDAPPAPLSRRQAVVLGAVLHEAGHVLYSFDMPELTDPMVYRVRALYEDVYVNARLRAERAPALGVYLPAAYYWSSPPEDAAALPRGLWDNWHVGDGLSDAVLALTYYYFCGLVPGQTLPSAFMPQWVVRAYERMYSAVAELSAGRPVPGPRRAMLYRRMTRLLIECAADAGFEPMGDDMSLSSLAVYGGPESEQDPESGIDFRGLRPVPCRYTRADDVLQGPACVAHAPPVPSYRSPRAMLCPEERLVFQASNALAARADAGEPAATVDGVVFREPVSLRREVPGIDLQAVAGLRAALSALVSSRPWYEDRRTEGRLSGRRLARLLPGMDGRAFRARTGQHLRPEAAVVLLIDASGSMSSGPYDRALTAAAEILEAARMVPGITVHVWAFRGEHDTVVLSPGRRTRAGYELPNDPPSGGTPGCEAIAAAADYLRRRHADARHRAVLTITDGEFRTYNVTDFEEAMAGSRWATLVLAEPGEADPPEHLHAVFLRGEDLAGALRAHLLGGVR